MSLCVIRANWPAPAGIHAITTTRHGGVSQGAFNSFNVGDHVGDDPNSVQINRQRLTHAAALPSTPRWLTQTHSTIALQADTIANNISPTADASYTDKDQIVCAVMTADCVPIVLCAPASGEIAAIHAGWRGLCDGVIEATVAKVNLPGEQLIAWIGPCISQAAFEVGDPVRDEFIHADPAAADAFISNKNGRWQANLVKISTQRLQQCGITGIYGGHFCTYREADRFFSYRRDQQTGRLATLIWRDATTSRK